MSVKKELRKHDVKVEIDARSEKIGYKIREARLNKLPYMLIVGEKEEAEGNVSVRGRGDDGDLGSMALADFVEKITTEIRDKVHD